jgi:hypothetical protein
MSDVLTGAAAGLTATAPMTAVMTVLHRQLPARQRRPLPPQQITAGTLAAAGIPAHLVWGGVLGILTEAVQRPTPGAEPEPVETERVERLPRPEPVGPVHQPGT